MAFESASSGRAFPNLDLTIGNGEVVGLYGKIGSGTAEVAEVAFGIRKLTSGRLRVGPADPGSPAGAGDRRGHRLPAGRPPARRRVHGAVVAKNLCAPSWRAARARTHGDHGPGRGERRTTAGTACSASARGTIPSSRSAPSREATSRRSCSAAGSSRDRACSCSSSRPAASMSAPAPRSTVIRSLAADGIGVLVVTSDYEEVVQVADRALVMSRGAVSAHLVGDQVTVERLSSAAGE